MDSTPNPKLDALLAAFQAQQGEVFIGDAAWEHLDSVAGPTMALFLERYVRTPLQSLLREAPEVPQPLEARWNETSIDIRVGSAAFQIPRHEPILGEDVSDEMPDDAADAVTDE